MKKTLLGFFLIASCLLAFVSCKDDFKLLGDFVETPVVIGILDQSETTHYIKVTRTFIGDGQTSALELAQIPDSSYFNDVQITINEQPGDGSQGRTFVLHDTIIENKSTSGVFYAPQQKVYVFYTSESAPLLGDAKYSMTINIDNGRIVVKGETGMVNGMTVSNNITGLASSIKLVEDPGEYKSQLVNITSVGNAYVLNAKLRFDYREYAPGMTDSTDKSVHMDIGETDVSPGFGSSHTFSIQGGVFYDNLKNAIDPPSASIEKRKYTAIEIQITGGSKELASYIAVNEPTSNLAQNKPEYTNLSVSDGFKVIGILGARHTMKFYKPATGLYPQIQALDKKSRRELCTGPVTGLLGFCSDHIADMSPTMETWYCD